MRKIIHIDMDCFYAAIEMRDDPSLRNVPIAVGEAQIAEALLVLQIMKPVATVFTVRCLLRLHLGFALT